MFKKSGEDRLSDWSAFRSSLNSSAAPLQDVAALWASAPMVTYVTHINPDDTEQWPTPWELLIENKYDDFVLALMMAYTIKLSQRYENSRVELKTMVDSQRTKLYTLVFVDSEFILNYQRDQVVLASEVQDLLHLENSLEIVYPR